MNAVRVRPSVLRPGAILGLARTQYLELVRQPVFGAVLAAGLVVVLLSPALSIFSFGRAEAFVLDLGASAMLFFGVALAAVAVAAGAAERLADGTTTLLLTQPVGPASVLAGALLGAAAALAQAGLLLGVALSWAVRHGPDALHWGVLLPALLATALALGWGLRASLRRQPFQPAAISAATLLWPLALAASLGLDRAGGLAASPAALDGTALAAAALATLAAATFAALGVALATRLPAPAAATLTLVGFVAASLVQGPLSPEALGPVGHLTALLPDLQLYWVGDAAYAGRDVPAGYVLELAVSSALYALGALGVAACLLDGRELGRG